MFTGIITGMGRIVDIHCLGSSSDHGQRITIETPAGYLGDVGLGDSIALNGACMTVVSLESERNRFCVEISAESLAKTRLFIEAELINLEKALRGHDRLGGHLVSGHVDGVGRVSHFAPLGESWELRIHAPPELSKYLAYKGSITVNGVSLTVNRILDLANGVGTEININLITHTYHNTALGQLAEGCLVNLEVDLIARYVERMLKATNLTLPQAQA